MNVKNVNIYLYEVILAKLKLVFIAEYSADQ